MRHAEFLCVLFLLLATSSCDSTGPSEADFLISSIEFTGDSTGTDHADRMSACCEFRGALTVPFCEFTLDWEAPFPDTRFEYTVFRSEEPLIPSDPSEATELTTILQRSWSDSQDLEWGTDYYYAVRAMSPGGSTKWSNEVCVTTPGSPFPDPAALSMEKIGFSSCRLQWTEWPDSCFKAYTLLRSYLPDIEHNPEYMHDTLYATTDRSSLSFTDSTVTGVHGFYYILVTENTKELSSFSNEVYFLPGADIPWRVTRTIWLTWPSDCGHRIRNMSPTGDCFYESSFGDWYEDFHITRRSCSNGSYLGSIACEAEVSTVLLNGNIAISEPFLVPVLRIYSSDLQEIISTSTPVICSMVDTPCGILVSGTTSSWLYDPNSLEVLETFSDSHFDDAVLSTDGNRVYLRFDGSGVIGLLLPGFDVFGELPVSYQYITCGSDGNLHCANETETAVYDGATLQLIDDFVFPEGSSPLQGVSFLLPECRYLYGWSYSEQGGCIVHVLDTEAKVQAGTIHPGGDFLAGPERFFSSPEGSFLWMALQGLDSSCLMKLGI